MPILDVEIPLRGCSVLPLPKSVLKHAGNAAAHFLPFQVISAGRTGGGGLGITLAAPTRKHLSDWMEMVQCEGAVEVKEGARLSFTSAASLPTMYGHYEEYEVTIQVMLLPSIHRLTR
jgi:hypothetical protein